MASIVGGFEFDVFISYRHNENLDGWVSGFVADLAKELKGIVKVPISICCDTNPSYGFLENYSVVRSLKGKLRCLIFIPVISQTYCDTKGFAWKNEFCVFNKQAREDEIGMDINLANGNIMSRILPIKIHDIDSKDTSILECELGGVLRAIEFFHKTPGVNRPLTSGDDEVRPQGKILYHDQVKKVANAIIEIIRGIKHVGISATGRESLISQAWKLPLRGKMKGRNVLWVRVAYLLLFFLLATAVGLFLL